MKKILHSAVFALLIGTAAAQTIPNNSFENWNYNIWMDPTNYTTANDQYVPYGIMGTVTQTSGAGSFYHGAHAVKLMTDTVRVGGVKDTLQAYMANGNPGGGGPITGGIPYAQKPTGMRFYYTCDVKLGDTALVLAVFKKAGSPIGICEAKLIGNVGTWTLYTQPATIFLTPDTVVFACTSSNLLLNGYSGLPGSTLFIDSVTFTGVASQPALMNGDFENWTTDTAAFPTSWSGSYPGVYQTTDKKGGTYAVEMKTQGKTVFNNAQPGQITTGYSHNGLIMGGNPITNQVDTLMFWYKYTPTGSDTANVNIQFKKNGGFVFGTGKYLLPSASYRLDSVPFNTGSAIDSAIIRFQSTNTYQLAQNHVGSDLKVDNIYYK